jgi:hypothetical protein
VEIVGALLIWSFRRHPPLSWQCVRHMCRWQSCAGARFNLHPEKIHDIVAGKGIEVVGAIEISWKGIVEGGEGRIVDVSTDCEIGGEGVLSTQRKNL